MAAEEQKSRDDDALSVNEEFQAANEELIASKEELQSLNEELTALNGQLQETLEHQRTTSNDLQNILYSTDVATLFLNTDLKIRFFTPSTKTLFSIIPSDIDRPLADLRSRADSFLRDDAQSVLRGHAGIERETDIDGRVWSRRVLPYLTGGKNVEGVVITFTDITDQKQAREGIAGCQAASRPREHRKVAVPRRRQP